MLTKKRFEQELNELGAPANDTKEYGGRIPDHAKYGSWLRRNDPIAFEVAYGDEQRERR